MQSWPSREKSSQPLQRILIHVVTDAPSFVVVIQGRWPADGVYYRVAFSPSCSCQLPVKNNSFSPEDEDECRSGGGAAARGVPCRIIRALILFGTTQHHQSAQCEEQSSAVACCMSATSSDDRPPPLLQQPVRLLLTSRPNRTHASRITINVDRRHRLRVLSHGPIPLQTHTCSILLCLSAAQYTSQCRITSY